MNLDPNVIELSGVLVALLVGTVSILISVFSLIQNSKMIEESTRPVISIYGAMTNLGTPQHYIVVKNFGQTTATITKFDYDFKFNIEKAYAGRSNDHDWLKDLVTANLAPGQSQICALNYDRINKPITFTYEYKTSTKTYKEKVTINLKAGIAMIKEKSDGINNDSLKAISYTLQGMYQKNL
jgi:hypothetical protein